MLVHYTSFNPTSENRIKGRHTCSLGLILKLPAVGFMQATYCVLCISFRVSFCLSYLHSVRKKIMFGLVSRTHQTLSKYSMLWHETQTDNWTTGTSVISPVPIIQMLAYKRVRLHCSITVNSWHVHIINKVDHPSAAYRGIAPACFFL